MRVIGITGTIGAGKGTIVDYLVKHHGYRHFSVRDLLVARLQERGMEISRDNMADLANEIRANHFPSYIIEQLYDQASAASSRCIIESIRTPGEAKALRGKGPFFLFAVDADSRSRYDRIVKRGSSTDGVTYAEFVEDEEREMRSTDPNKQNISACLKLADYAFTNNGSFIDLFEQVERALLEIEEKKSVDAE